MEDLSDNNLIRFKNITRKKDSIFANFKVSGIRAGVTFTAQISVDLAAAEQHAGDTLEDIIEKCAEMGAEEFQRAQFQFEGLQSI